MLLSQEPLPVPGAACGSAGGRGSLGQRRSRGRFLAEGVRAEPFEVGLADDRDVQMLWRALLHAKLAYIGGRPENERGQDREVEEKRSGDRSVDRAPGPRVCRDRPSVCNESKLRRRGSGRDSGARNEGEIGWRSLPGDRAIRNQGKISPRAGRKHPGGAVAGFGKRCAKVVNAAQKLQSPANCTCFAAKSNT